MTKEDISKIIELLKSGKEYKTGHYHYGYIYYFYRKNEKLFYEKREDLSINIYEPTIEINEYSEKDFISKILEKEEFNDFVKHLI